MAASAKVFEYAVEVDHAGRMTIPGGAQIESAEGWSPDHFLLAALVRCSIDSLGYHARRAGHEVIAAGEAHGEVTRRESDGRYALTTVSVRIQAAITPRVAEPSALTAKAERDCFVAASLTVAPTYEWSLS